MTLSYRGHGLAINPGHEEWVWSDHDLFVHIMDLNDLDTDKCSLYFEDNKYFLASVHIIHKTKWKMTFVGCSFGFEANMKTGEVIAFCFTYSQVSQISNMFLTNLKRTVIARGTIQDTDIGEVNPYTINNVVFGCHVLKRMNRKKWKLIDPMTKQAKKLQLSDVGWSQLNLSMGGTPGNYYTDNYSVQVVLSYWSKAVRLRWNESSQVLEIPITGANYHSFVPHYSISGMKTFVLRHAQYDAGSKCSFQRTTPGYYDPYYELAYQQCVEEECGSSYNPYVHLHWQDCAVDE